ncbi:low temperature requirement protein A [Micromonospora polyrhachis]|uniref:Low temperature requirement protein LtrA n=1 Tax=Micromonospora polyrhachis TaxID=1282883 RepID=A0A7W7WPL8_9ACTN|nr:low temperature requirement protein A [Micromonospora polyrhachis]MBB4958834.1 low temperature requirement protein LtrA [Micromonospora polyrhachis]
MTERCFGEPDGPTGRANGQERHSSWLELFFDLAFVFATTTVSARLGPDTHITWGDALATLGLFTALWWAWIGQAFFDTRFDCDDVPQRLSVLVAMVGAGAMAVGVTEAPHTLLFPIGYLIVRGTLLALYLRVRASQAGFHWVTRIYLPGFGLGWLLWFGSLFTPVGVRPALWAIGLGVELLTPWVGRYLLRQAPVHTSHLPERIGLFTIILLGVTLTDLLDAVSDTPSASVLASAVVAFCVPASIWWVYSIFVSRGVRRDRLRGGQAYAYLHGGLGAAILLLGWGLGQSLAQVGTDAEDLPTGLRLLLAAAVGTWMVCGAGLQRITFGTVSAARLLVTVGGVTLAAVVSMTMPTPVATIVALAVVLAGYAFAISRHLTRIGQPTAPLGT